MTFTILAQRSGGGGSDSSISDSSFINSIIDSINIIVVLDMSLDLMGQSVTIGLAAHAPGPSEPLVKVIDYEIKKCFKLPEILHGS